MYIINMYYMEKDIIDLAIEKYYMTVITKSYDKNKKRLYIKTSLSYHSRLCTLLE